MPRSPAIDEKALTRTEVRKLDQLRQSFGTEIGTRTFLDWLRGKPSLAVAGGGDRTALAIAECVERLLADGRIDRLPRGGYVVRRGRGRVIVERPT